MSERDADAAQAPSISIVIPVFNEVESIGAVLEGVRSSIPESIRAEVIVVDDGSTDDSARLVEEFPDVLLIRHGRNLGTGAAKKTGIRAARGETIVTLDGDGQHDPSAIAELLETMKREKCDMVVGARTAFLHTRLWRLPGKWLVSSMAILLVGRSIPDLNCGLRAVRKDVICRYLHLFPAGFSFHTTSTLVLIERGFKVCYVPVMVRRRGAGRSWVTPWTGLETILLILRLATLLAPLRLFVPLSALFSAAGTGWGLRYLLAGRGLSTGALFLLVTGIYLFFFGLLADQIAALRKERME